MASQRAASLVLLLSGVLGVAAQDMSECFSAGSVAGAVLGTLAVTLALALLGYAFYRIYWRNRRGRHLMLVTDPERADIGDKYAFDNPCFRDGTPLSKGGYEKEPVKSENKSRWSQWSPLGALVGNHSEKRRALDDSFPGEPQVNVVSLRSHDFTGLGFSICGNMRDGIFVKDVLHRGPASESGCITPGDRIDSIRISFRHMVFEDALTILSYASPYEVQLEVENPSPSSRPSTLLRTKRETLEPADRICHPFYRSQSIADLAQIGTASLKRVQDMGGLKSPRRVKGDGWDDSRSSDYPTLKLSPSPAKERVNLEKAASPSNPTSAAIVKPERSKKPSPKLDDLSSQHGSDVNKDVVGKHQKFGVRVLPDAKALVARLKSTSDETTAHLDVSKKPHSEPAPQDTAHASNNPGNKKPNMTETEHRENEQNSIVEQISTAPVAIKTNVSGNIVIGQAGASVEVVDTSKPQGRLLPKTLFYDERAIDVGPEEEEENRRKSASYELKHMDEDSSKRQHTEGPGSVDNHNNVKLLLTKGLQNLKEKLHHHDKKKTSTTPEPQSDVEVNPNPSPSKKKPVKMEKLRKSPSSDSDGTPETIEVKMRSNPQAKIVNKEDKENELKKEMKTEVERQYNEGEIPTEVPEEVQRAAAAARSNRKSIGNRMPDISVSSQVQNKNDTDNDSQVLVTDSQVLSVLPADGENMKRVHHRESFSEDSSGEHNDGENGDKIPKKSNKRKAPLPPPEDGEDEKTSQNSLVSGSKTDKPTEVETSGIENDPHIFALKNIDNCIPKMENTPPTIVNSSEIQISGSLPTFTEMGRQQNNPPIQNQITNIIVESSNTLPESNSLTVEMSGSNNIDEVSPSSKTTDVNSESDSDVEQPEVDASSNRNKKGGTTIELNSSHITIHHSPSVDTVTLELEADNTRKAASLGDLSRFDTDQPMSVLERAVSLDLADSGTPLSCKKRKAPLPPPCDDYINNVQDNEDETLYRKEPRLDNALDTFQRRRLKKSSDWGTMEDAVQQASPPTSKKALNIISDINVVVTDTTAPLLADVTNPDHKPMETNETDPKEEDTTKNIVPLDSVNVASFPKASARTFELKGQPHTLINTQINLDDDHMHVSVHSGAKNGLDSEANAEGIPDVVESYGPQRTVLRISPEPSSNMEQVTSSRVTFAPTSSTSGPSSLNAHELMESQSPDQNVDVNGGHSLTFIQGHNGDTPFDTSYPSTPTVSQSTEHHTIVSSTPLPSRDHHTHYIETVQSQQVTSTEGGVQNIQVVSSSTHTSSAPPDVTNVARISRNLLGTGAFESNVLSKPNDSYNDSETNIVVTSATDPYITAGSIVDSTTTFMSNSDDEDSTLGQDSPPELPTSPVPVMASSYTPSSSMTYITEIQVSTITPSKGVASHTITHNGNLETEVPIRTRESSISSDSIGSGGEDRDTEAIVSQETTSLEESIIPSSNVTVTSIRNTSASSSEKSKIPMRVGTETILTTFQSGPNVGVFERSQIPMRSGTDGIMTTFQSAQSNMKSVDSSHIPVRVGAEGILTTFKSNVSVGSGDKSQIPTRVSTSTIQDGSPTVNNSPSFGEKKGKAVRPPVPPRKSDTSVSSVVTVEIPSPTRSADNIRSKVVGGSSQFGVIDSTSSAQNNGGSSKKFISFSSLTPRSVSGDNSGRNSSSFEQWVFLEGDGAHNGQDTSVEDGTHSAVVTLPGRPSSVTHILLDAKQSSGSRSTQ